MPKYLKTKFARTLASFGLFAVTGCSLLPATDYREEYGYELPPENSEAAVAATDVEAAYPPASYAADVVDDDAAMAMEFSTPEPEAAIAASTQPGSVDEDFAAFVKHNMPQKAPSENRDLQAVVAAHAQDPFAAVKRGKIQQVSAETPAVVVMNSKHKERSATTFRQAEPRLPGTQACCPPADCVTIAASPMAQAYPDEYICDGGDRDVPVHYPGGEREGLDTEDTIAEFKDHHGDNHVRASNRVCIYAPRFGAVETVSGPGIDVKIDRAAGGFDVAGPDALLEERGLDTNVASTPASGVAVRSGAGGVETAQVAHMSEKRDPVFQNRRVEQGFESKTTRGVGAIEMSAIHHLNLQIQEPATSDIKTFVGRTQATSQATQTYAMFRLAAMTGSEDGGTPGEVHITKEAFPLVAKSGDIVTFTIHFRNTGDYNVNEVRIIDNLTPRLTYMSGSAEVKVPGDGAGDLSVVPNKDGGQLLQFELDQPLKGGQSGMITFRAKVL